MTSIYARVTTPRDSDEPRRLRIVAVGLYGPEVVGRAGDRITFLFPGRLPTTGELSIEQVEEYRIMSPKTTNEL